MTRSPVSVQFDNVSKCFSTPARGEVWALRDAAFCCPAGQLTCIVGPSGCGKTTLLRLAGGLERPTHGRVLLDGSQATAGAKGIGMVCQEGALLPWRRVLGNVELGLEIRGLRRAQRRQKARAVLRRVHLPPEVDRSFPHELSGGMRQRAALARALCPEPPVLLMDEPFASLDEWTRQRLQAELLALWTADRPTILFVTHNIEEATFLAGRLIVMTFGRPVAEFDVPIPHPRDRLSGEFTGLLRKVRRSFLEHSNR